MPAKPHVTIADDNQTPTTAEQQTDTNWAQPVSVRDGHNATLGAKADTAVTDPTLSATEIALLKGLLTILKGTLAVGGTVNVGNFPATQQVDPIDRAARLMGHVTVDSSAVTTNTLQPGATATGNGIPMPVAGLATVALYVSGTFVATVVFEGTTVATNPQPADWFSINAHQSGTTTVGTTATTPGIYRASVAGLVSVRARVSTWTSGTVTVTGTAVAVEDTSKVTAASITGRNVIDVILQNAAAAVGGGSPFAPTNGNNTLTFEVRGSSASRSVNFEIAGPGGIYAACTAFKVTDPTVAANSTTGGTDAAPEAWQVDVPVGWSFRANLIAVAGGNVSITGKAVVS